MARCLSVSFAIAALAIAAWIVWPSSSAPTPDAQVIHDAPSAAPAYHVARIIDADTLDVTKPDGQVLRVRVLDIDAPERGQPGGDEATAWVRAMLEEGEAVELVGDETDRYGRRLAEIRHDGGLDLAEGLVRAGHAWRWSRAVRPDLEELAGQAREARLGLWANPAPIDPSAWRKLSAGQREAARQASQE